MTDKMRQESIHPIYIVFTGYFYVYLAKTSAKKLILSQKKKEPAPAPQHIQYIMIFDLGTEVLKNCRKEQIW